jgi:hypothetical protein
MTSSNQKRFASPSRAARKRTLSSSVAGERHVFALTQEGTMPVEGGFFFDGAVVNSTLDTSVRVSTR